MGGPVQIGVRNTQGDVFAGETYTSSIGTFFDNDRFFIDDIFHVRQHLIDYAEEGYRIVMPNCYGLVFGDHITKKSIPCKVTRRPDNFILPDLQWD